MSKEAIDRVRQTFPQQKSQFHVISMTEKDVQVQDESQDVVLSLGAFAMYLYKDEMEIALNDTFLHRKRISPRKLFLAQGKVFPRAVFNPPRVGLYIPSEARAVIETQGGLKTARGYTFV